MPCEAVVGLGASVEAVPELAAWLRSQLTDEVSRVVWWTVLSQTGLAILLGVAASLLLAFPAPRLARAAHPCRMAPPRRARS